jgi:PAS domain S-box-containing protein
MKENQANIKQFKNEINKQLLAPLGALAKFTAVAGIFALIFEVRYFSGNALDIYFARLGATTIAFLVLLLSNFKFGKKHPVALVHVLLLSIIGSFGYVIYVIPETLVFNSQIISLIIFIAALFLSWEVHNQITVAIYYNIVFAASILLNGGTIYYLPNIFISVLFVIFLSVMSIAACAYNYKLRKSSILNALEVAESEKKYKELFENSAEGIFRMDISGKIEIGNPAYISLLGYSDISQITSDDFKNGLYRNPKDLELFLKLMERHGKLKNYRLILRRKDKKEIIVRCSARTILNEKNEPIGYEGSIQDITRQVRAEKEKEKANEELKNAKLLADDSAIRARTESDIKTKFLSKLGHEIKTPLNSIMAFLTMIHDDLFENYKELKDFAGEIQTSADLLLEIINKNIDLSQMESGKIDLDENRFNLSNEIDKTINLVNASQKEKKIAIIKNYDETIPKELIGDEKRLRQVLLNLLANAVKFTEKGDVHLNAYLEGKSGTHAQVLFSIRDNGPGIDEELLPSLFNPYSSATKGESKGTGLSLAISKELVNLMGGQIDVETSPGEGSTFTFTARFKLIEVDKSLLEKESQLEDQIEEQEPVVEKHDTKVIDSDMARLKSAESGELRKKRILLVEDNPISQNVEMKILREVGYSVEAVGSGIEAIDMLALKPFDIVLMDVEMEGMDGIEATQRIRGLDGNIAKIPVIAVTAHSSMKDRERCLTAGMDDYIAKPINIQFLKMTIDQWLNDNRLI